MMEMEDPTQRETVAVSDAVTPEEISIFNEDILSDNIENKVDAIRNLVPLAKAIGPERTRTELLSNLEDQISILDDEILALLADELREFLPLIGGGHYSKELFDILLKISRNDEAIVRDKAVETIKVLVDDLDPNYVQEFLISNVLPLREDTWFCDKFSTLALTPILYSKANAENKTMLRKNFCLFVEEDSALIRKFAAISLIDFVAIVELEFLLKEFIPVLRNIAKDDQDSVRVNTIQLVIGVAKRLNNDEVKADIFQMVEQLISDCSWRIRQRIAFLIHDLAGVFTNEKCFYQPLLKLFDDLIYDIENEVRIFAVRNFYAFCENLHKMYTGNFDNSFKEQILPLIHQIIKDECEEVRIPVSEKLLEFASLISGECFIDDVLPVLNHCLENEASLVCKVNLLKNFDRLPKEMNVSKLLTSVNKVIKGILLSFEVTWRTRRDILPTFIHLSKFCTEDFFNKNLLVYYFILLKDSVYAVRRTAAMALPFLAKRYGVKWFLDNVMAQLHFTLKHEKYLIRYIILFCLQELINPSVGRQRKKYLSNFENSISNNKVYTGRIRKIVRLQSRLNTNLQEKWCKDIVENYGDDYNINKENTKLYCEDIFNCFENEQEANTEEELKYLEGVLFVLTRELSEVLHVLVKDPISNVQERARFLLVKINQFNEDVNSELNAVGIQPLAGDVSEKEWAKIDQEIDAEKQDIESKFKFATDNEKIDTELERSVDEIKSVKTATEEPEGVVFSELVSVSGMENLTEICKEDAQQSEESIPNTS